MREIGAIQPCHTPEKNPARSLIVADPSPGIQEHKINDKIISNPQRAFFFIVYRLISYWMK